LVSSPALYALAPVIVAVFLFISAGRRWFASRRIARNPEGFVISRKNRVMAGMVALAIFLVVFMLLPRLTQDWARIAVAAAAFGGLEQALLAVTPGARYLTLQYRVFAVGFVIAAFLILIVTFFG
jgi:hypothetical protein